jgi:cytochrome bd-type quinol oxidase subunit 2
MISLFGAKIKGSDINIPEITGQALLKNGLNLVYFILGIVAVIMIIFSGYQYLTANGDPGKAATAMKTILFSVIGLVVVASAFAITSFVMGNV